ncbi:ABC transporter permease [Rhodococcus aetherivorans]|uniref:ABC transporter permease n=1 Tax=Rhodococcus aetherivorans TaxID=191292 RepID=UPI0002D23574|nr:ABC transporter permease [Rhodococcus aetherivorans]CCW14773.1 Ribose ABC transport system, permease protein RbsC (TC 3.A.1.2.1 [Rhodococcus aetherivorans]
MLTTDATGEVTTPTEQAAPPRPTMRHVLLTAGPLGALIGLCTIFAILAPGFATATNAMAIVEQAAIPVVLAMGATLVVLVGGIDLSIEGVMAAGGLSFVLLAANSVNGNDLGLLAVLAGVAVGLIFGLVNGVLHVVGRVPSFLVTLGTWFIGLGVATVLFGTTTPKLADSALTTWAGGEWLGLPVVVVFAVGAVAVTLLVCKGMRLGMHTYAIGGDEATSRLAGIPVGRTKIILFAVAGVFSGLGGVLATIRLGVGDVSVGSGSLFLTLSAVVVGGTLLSGGRGGPLHSLVGVLLLIVLGNGLLLSGASPYIQQGAQGLIIVIAVIATGWPARSRLRVVK